MEYVSIFGKGGHLGHVKGYKATIKTEGDLPPLQQPQPVGPEKRMLIEKTIDQLLAWDVVEPSISKTASPVVMVWQNGKWQFCIDFRQLNTVTVGDTYPMLCSDYVFSILAEKHFFTLLDALKGYHQVEIEEKDHYKYMFILYKGLY